MKRIIVVLAMPLLFILSGGCKKPGCLGAAGRLITVTRPLDSFNEIILADNINLLLTQGTEEKIQIEAPENMIPNITGTISQNRLMLTNAADCRWARNAGETINVHLFFKDLKKIQYSGSGMIANTDTLRLDALQIETAGGAGNINLTLDNRYTGSYILSDNNAAITLHGNTDICYTYTNAKGKTDMSDFKVKKMVIEYEGLDDTRVYVTDELDAIIYHKGNIYYKGTPVISRSVYYSSGRLIYSP